MGFVLFQSVNADAWCEQSFNVIVYASRIFLRFPKVDDVIDYVSSVNIYVCWR